MTKKDYIIIARAIRNAGQYDNDHRLIDISLIDLINQLESEFMQDNHRFDSQRFTKAIFGN